MTPHRPDVEALRALLAEAQRFAGLPRASANERIIAHLPALLAEIDRLKGAYDELAMLQAEDEALIRNLELQIEAANEATRDAEARAEGLDTVRAYARKYLLDKRDDRNCYVSDEQFTDTRNLFDALGLDADGRALTNDQAQPKENDRG